jgi:hypothetical protein
MDTSSRNLVGATEPLQLMRPFLSQVRNLAEALIIANELQMLCFWLYFALGEAFFAGSSLGKRICRIRSVSTVNLDKPSIMAGHHTGWLENAHSSISFFPSP